MDWAKKSRKIQDSAVVGAVINLGHCFDLFDQAAIHSLTELYPVFSNLYKSAGKDLPMNQQGFQDDPDNLKRHLDCTMINWAMDFLELEGKHYDSVRGLFPEGRPAFEGSGIMAKSHIQIAIRNTACIVGYFRPS
ncbi:hypothetical protein ACFPK9_02870 [Rubritalea spongiae]|uniref:Uncharacterized protein n=1 Tax=Rubritalea spongiae TaxID=430797 RepID=A0ABW5E0H2_9BACT